MRTLFLSLMISMIGSHLSIADDASRLSTVINGNNVIVQIYNYGSFSSPGNRITNFVWNGLGYSYEFGFFVGGEVDVPPGSHQDVIFMDGKYIAHIISDGLVGNGGEFSPDRQERWGWQPVLSNYSETMSYLDLQSTYLPLSNGHDKNLDNIPDNWPEEWWNSDLNRYTWPGIWRPDEIIGDLETLYGMDDRYNKEFEYYPFPDDTSHKGLGIEVETRIFQFQDFYQDIIFITFDIENVSEKPIEKALFGVWGDPHIGGPDDFSDDLASYDIERNMCYTWDADGFSINNPSITPGYMGVAFLQTPGNHYDGLDNDSDGFYDESPYDGIDNDNDWNPLYDDLGQDGIANTYDQGESDGQPTFGEPNFDIKDVDEVDMLGLTSFSQPTFGSLYINQDEKVWQQHQPGSFDTAQVQGDYIFTGGTGYFKLLPGQITKIGVAFLFAQNKELLEQTADRAKDFYKVRLGIQAHDFRPVIESPTSEDEFENMVDLQWNSSDYPAHSEIDFAYSIDGGQLWQPALYGLQNTGSYSWDVSSLPNSVFYNLRMRVREQSGYGENTSTGFFKVDHSGAENVPPEVYLNLVDGQILKNSYGISWLSGDDDGYIYTQILHIN
jgi:hypothetical protein